MWSARTLGLETVLGCMLDDIRGTLYLSHSKMADGEITSDAQLLFVVQFSGRRRCSRHTEAMLESNLNCGTGLKRRSV